MTTKGMVGTKHAPLPPLFQELIYGDEDNAFKRLAQLLSHHANKENLPSMTGFIYSRETVNGTPAHLVTPKFTGDYQRVLMDKDDGMSKLHFTMTVARDGTISQSVDHWI